MQSLRKKQATSFQIIIKNDALLCKNDWERNSKLAQVRSIRVGTSKILVADFHEKGHLTLKIGIVFGQCKAPPHRFK